MFLMPLWHGAYVILTKPLSGRPGDLVKRSGGDNLLDGVAPMGLFARDF
jgi:hypothetical protein